MNQHKSSQAKIQLPATPLGRCKAFMFSMSECPCYSGSDCRAASLLIRGEPDRKSQLARAAAKALKRKFIYEVIKPIRDQDLWYRFDASALWSCASIECAAKDKTQEESMQNLTS